MMISFVSRPFDTGIDEGNRVPRVSISDRHLKGSDSALMFADKPFFMNSFHGVSSRKPRPGSLKLKFGKVTH
jgi:hypothetical protein